MKKMLIFTLLALSMISGLHGAVQERHTTQGGRMTEQGFAELAQAAATAAKDLPRLLLSEKSTKVGKVAPAEKMRDAIEEIEEAPMGALEFRDALNAFDDRERSIDFSNYRVFDSSKPFDPPHLFGPLYAQIHREQLPPYEFFKKRLYEMFEPAGLAFLVDWYIEELDNDRKYRDIRHNSTAIAKMLFLLERARYLRHILNPTFLQSDERPQALYQVVGMLSLFQNVLERAKRATGLHALESMTTAATLFHMRQHNQRFLRQQTTRFFTKQYQKLFGRKLSNEEAQRMFNSQPERETSVPHRQRRLSG